MRKLTPQPPRNSRFLAGRLNTGFIFPGELGIWQTISTMRDLALEAAHDPAFCEFASQITHGSNHEKDQIQYLRNFVFRHVHYTDDPETFEYVKHPFLLLEEIQKRGYAEGDCDDHATLLAAFLTCRGIHNLIAAMELPEAGNDGYNHVVNGIPNPDGTFILVDTSAKDGYQGYQIGAVMRITVF